MSDSEFKAALHSLYSDVQSTLVMETALAGKGPLKQTKPRWRKRQHQETTQSFPEAREATEITKTVLDACITERRKAKANAVKVDTSDEKLSSMARFTDRFKLKPYEKFLHYVPRIVNVVTLAEAIPAPGSCVTLPLDLHHIAARCRNAFYAPKKFSAVQLAYSEPRCRILAEWSELGQTDRWPLDWHSCEPNDNSIKMPEFTSILEIFLSSIRSAQPIRHLAVGAASLRATLECDKFASAHTSTAFYDAKSFVGLAWRPAGEPICCEIYSTGKANLPGSVVERQLQESFFRMLPELLRYSSASRLLDDIPLELQDVHRTDPVATESASFKPVASSSTLWEGWEDAVGGDAGRDKPFGSDDEEGIDLQEMGL